MNLSFERIAAVDDFTCFLLCRTSAEDIKSLRLITAIKTPYLPDGRFDLEAFDDLVHMQIEKRCFDGKPELFYYYLLNIRLQLLFIAMLRWTAWWLVHIRQLVVLVLPPCMSLSYKPVRSWKGNCQLVISLSYKYVYLFYSIHKFVFIFSSHQVSCNFLLFLFNLQYAFNLFSHNAPVLENGYNEEEMKMVKETRKIWVSS